MAKKDDEFPMTLTKGGAKVVIYSIGGVDRPRFQVAYYIGEQRKLKNKATVEEAKVFAKEQLDLAVAGRRAVAEMSEDDRNTYVAALAKLKPLGIGLMSAVEDYVAATMVMGDHGSLLMAAKDYVKQAEKAARICITDTGAAVEEFIGSRRLEWEKDPLTKRDYETIRSHCRQFSNHFHCPIQQILKKDIVNWLNAVTRTKRSYNNKRTSIVRLFKYAKLQGHLPDDKLSEAELVPRYKKVPHHEVYALPPDTLRTLFDKAMEGDKHEAALYFAFGSQTGMRTSELQKFHWEHCKMKRGIIDLPKWVTKNRQARHIPIHPALAAWIEVLGGPGKGKVFSSEKATDRSIDFARPFMPPKPAVQAPRKGKENEMSESDWWENCMRDSYGSYRGVTTKSIGLVAMEMGNSEPMVKRCYFDRKADEADGRLWFATGPAGWNLAKNHVEDSGVKNTDV